MVAALEKSLAKQVERGKLERGRARRRPSAGSRPPPTSTTWPTATSSSSRSSRTSTSRRSCSASSTTSCKDDAILATNTSTLPVVEMAMVTDRPDQVCGVHFFNPAPMMSAGRDRPAAHRHRRDHRRRSRAFAEACGKDAGRGQGPRRLHRQRAAVPVPQQRGADARERHRQPRRHRHRHEGRLQLPDGSARAARPRRPRHVAGHPRRPLRRVPRPELRRRARCCGAWSPPASSAGSRGVGFYDYRK